MNEVKNNKKEFDIILSLLVLFIFLSLLCFRMGWKLDYRFNNELVHICEGSVEIYNTYDTSDTIYKSDEYYTEMGFVYANIESICTAIENKEIKVRTDYAYTADKIKADIEKLIEKPGDSIDAQEYNRIVKNRSLAIYELNHLTSEHYTSIVFGFIFLVAAAGMVVCKVIVHLRKRRSE